MRAPRLAAYKLTSRYGVKVRISIPKSASVSSPQGTASKDVAQAKEAFKYASGRAPSSDRVE
jgi:hypothetical protein